MPLRLGLIAYPAFVMGTLLSRSKSTVGQFLKAGAVSPSTARNPVSVGVKYRDIVQRAVRRGALTAVGDGRYFVNIRYVQRARVRDWTILAVFTLLFAALGLIIWHPW